MSPHRFLGSFPETPLYVSPQVVERVVGVPWTTLEPAVRRGELRVFKVGKRRLLKLSEVNDYISSKLVTREVTG